MEKTFYMVYVQGCANPTYQHETLEAATTEAERLTSLFKKKAYVLVSIKSIYKNDFIVDDLRPNNDLPF